MESNEHLCLNKRIFVGGVPVKMDESTFFWPRNFKGLLLYLRFCYLLQTRKEQKESRASRICIHRIQRWSYHKKSTWAKASSQRPRGNITLTKIDVKQFALEKEIDKQQQEVLKRKVYLKGLPASCDQPKLLEIMSVYGKVDRAFILYNHKNGSSRGFGFVEFAKEESVAKAVGHKIDICGKEILISMAVERQKGVRPKFDPRKRRSSRIKKRSSKTLEYLWKN